MRGLPLYSPATHLHRFCSLPNLRGYYIKKIFLAKVYNYPITVGADRTFDLSTLPGNFNVTKASNWNGGTVNGNILTVNEGADKVTYTYDCGEGKAATFTLAAVPTSTYTVTFDANGGGGSMNSVTVNEGTYTLPECEFSGPVGLGQFAGWAYSADGEVITESTIQVTGDTVLYAIWSRDYSKVIDNIYKHYSHVDDVYTTVYMANGQVIDDPGDATYLDGDYHACDAADAVWSIRNVTVGDYALKIKGTNTFDGATEGLTGIEYIDSGIPYITTKRQVRHYDRDEYYSTYDTYERIADVTVCPVYKIIDGVNGAWTQNSDGTLTFRANGDFNKFTGVKIDGALIDASNYTAVSGSTVITLKADYLQTLSVGTHTLTVVYPDGECSTNFEIKVSQSQNTGTTPTEPNTPTTPSDADKTNPDASVTSPQTGDNSHLALWIALLFVSGAGVAGTTVYSKKRKALK